MEDFCHFSPEARDCLGTIAFERVVVRFDRVRTVSVEISRGTPVTVSQKSPKEPDIPICVVKAILVSLQILHFSYIFFSLGLLISCEFRAYTCGIASILGCKFINNGSEGRLPPWAVIR